MNSTCSKCDRRSALPAPYAPLCSRHYLEDLKVAQAAAQARFRARIDSLLAAKGKAWDWKNDKLAE